MLSTKIDLRLLPNAVQCFVDSDFLVRAKANRFHGLWIYIFKAAFLVFENTKQFGTSLSTTTLVVSEAINDLTKALFIISFKKLLCERWQLEMRYD